MSTHLDREMDYWRDLERRHRPRVERGHRWNTQPQGNLWTSNELAVEVRLNGRCFPHVCAEPLLGHHTGEQLWKTSSQFG